MINLSVKYLGLNLRNPIIVGSSGLTENTETIRNLEQNGAAVIKQLLAGATAVQVVSAIYRHGGERIGEMLHDLETWMGKHGFSSIDDFRGKLSQGKNDNPAAFERVQFMKYFRGFTG